MGENPYQTRKPISDCNTATGSKLSPDVLSFRIQLKNVVVVKNQIKVKHQLVRASETPHLLFQEPSTEVQGSV